MLYQSQLDINTFYCDVIQKVAASQKVGVLDWEFKSTMELLHEIHARSPNIFNLLDKFLQAYQSWYNVHVGINAAGTSGNLTPQQSQVLQNAIAGRDSTRQSLLSAL